MGLKLGHLEGLLSYFEAQLGSHFNQMKYFSNDLKLLGHSDFVSNISKIIVTRKPQNVCATNCARYRPVLKISVGVSKK